MSPPTTLLARSAEATPGELPIPRRCRPASDKAAHRLAAAAVEVAARPAQEAGSLGFMARAFIQANLPHRDPGDLPAWTRRNGDFLLQVVPGTTVGVTPVRRLGIPYGVYPRLILAFVTTEALRTRSPRIRLGCNLREAMERVGISGRTGGARGTITRFKDQLARLARAEIAWSFVQGSRVLSAGIKPFEGMEAFWTAEASGPFVSQLVLNERLFDEILRFSVPLDMRVVRTLARLGSSLAMDLYGWLTYRQFSLQRSGRPLLVPWGALEKQLGGDYGRTRDFRRQVGAALTMIGAVYAGANATPAPRGLLVRPGGVHVGPRVLAGASHPARADGGQGTPVTGGAPGVRAT